MGTEMSRRERNSRRTRTAIIRAAAELTIEHGYAHATIARIAERADVAPRTVSVWFPVKDDILFTGMAGTIERATRALREGDGDVVDRMWAWMFAEGESGAVEGDHELRLLMLRAVFGDPVLRALETRFFAPLQDALREAAADSLGVSAGAPGPAVFAAAAMGTLLDLRARVVSDAPGPGPGTMDAARVFLRAGLDAVRPG
ncbi:TetR/AcrR family transcriptional regulator [Patulibacter sp. SYSU D01012]|uniref:TetR/AcrR family transcriptional regulator n=1 Tax=Patulibacter sp. SYSU D01012 TaxID=2817381 RepID=UPI001B30127E